MGSDGVGPFRQTIVGSENIAVARNKGTAVAPRPVDDSLARFVDAITKAEVQAVYPFLIGKDCYVLVKRTAELDYDPVQKRARKTQRKAYLKAYPAAEAVCRYGGHLVSRSDVPGIEEPVSSSDKATQMFNDDPLQTISVYIGDVNEDGQTDVLMHPFSLGWHVMAPFLEVERATKKR